MIVHPTLPSGYAIFCDDVREELHGKTTLVGIYGGEMLLQASLPTHIPQLCCQLTVLIDPLDLPHSMALEIQKHTDANDIEVLSKVELPSPRKIPAPKDSIGFGSEKKLYIMRGAIRMPMFLIDVDMTLRAVAVIDGDQYRIGTLNVRNVDSLPERLA